LREAGHDVYEANDGAEGLEMVAQSSPEIMVADWLMPIMSGNEMIEAVRARDDDFAKIPIVVFTALSKTSPEVQSLETDPEICILHKPLEIRIVAEVVDQMLLEVAEAG
jgi:DNA-binding response OmpR family regulator